MVWIALAPIVIAGVGLVVMLVWAVAPGGRRRVSRSWIRQRGAPVTVDIVGEIEETLWRRRIGGLIGLLIGLAVVVPVVGQWDSTQDQALAPYFATFIVPYLLLGVGGDIAGLGGDTRDIGDHGRAPTDSTRLSDYVSRSGLVLVRISTLAIAGTAASALLLVSWAGWGFGPDESGYAWGVLVLITVIWVVVEMAARRLVARPLPGSDALTLFWRQALRGERLREHYRFLATLGFLLPLLVRTSLPHPSPDERLMTLEVSLLSLAALVLGGVAQVVLLRVPSTARRRESLQAARRGYETV